MEGEWEDLENTHEEIHICACWRIVAECSPGAHSKCLQPLNPMSRSLSPYQESHIVCITMGELGSNSKVTGAGT